MKTLNRNYLIFVTLCILLFIYFYFYQYFYTINLYDTYYLISYFFFVVAAFIIGTVFYLRKILIQKLEKRIEESQEKHSSKYLLMFLKPISYLKMNSVTKYYLIFVVLCILLSAYFYLADYFYLASYNGAYHFVSYYYFVLPILIIGTIFYFVKTRQTD